MQVKIPREAINHIRFVAKREKEDTLSVSSWEIHNMKIGNVLQKVVKFLAEVRIEMKKVSWPTRQQTWRNTSIVIGVSVATAVFLGGLDAVFAWLINKII